MLYSRAPLQLAASITIKHRSFILRGRNQGGSILLPDSKYSLWIFTFNGMEVSEETVKQAWVITSDHVPLVASQGTDSIQNYLETIA